MTEGELLARQPDAQGGAERNVHDKSKPNE